MVTEPTADETVEEAVEHLMSEIARYLEVVEAFRAEGAEPSWIDDEALPYWWLEELRPQQPSTEAVV